MLDRLLNKFRSPTGSKAIVLMYHRVAELKTDPWQLSVSPQNFEEQISVLQKKKYKFISTNELAEQMENNSISAKTACITFDDGYADNYTNAAPVLENHGIKACFFICTGYIGSGKKFWWDSLEDILLNSPELPTSLSLDPGGESFTFSSIEKKLCSEHELKHASWVWPAPAPTERIKLYLSLRERLRPLVLSKIGEHINEIKDWAGYKAGNELSDYPMDDNQLNKLAASKYFELGIHTHTHPALSFHSRGYQENEIVGCRQELDIRFGKKCSALAYPYGIFNEDTISIAKQENLSLAFTTHEQIVTSSSDPYQLGRFHVKNWTGKDFEEHLDNWNRYY